ncbi:MAG: hypothetical protein K2K64_02685 [Muribaculaceae bacterium]|nr:hypothetical protein [Muribaculaceae bacterium]
MIRVGIIGADSPEAGELLRILIHHPEVDIACLYAPSMPGHRITSVHHGFIGEEDLFFSDKIDLSKIDALFLTDDSPLGDSIVERLHEWENLKIINLSPSRFSDWSISDFEYGLSEVNRKPLVRGARNAIVPSPVASLVLVALYPLASHLLLSSDIKASVKMPESLIETFNPSLTEIEIVRSLKKAQNSFEGKISFNISQSASERSMRIGLALKCPLGIDEISKIYDSVYDDHNFTFISRERIDDAEVEGTQKCLISVSKPGAGLLEIEIVADGRLRGGAGDAVHALNLLFALHEKVGLSLKPSVYSKTSGNSENTRTSWFA